MLFKIYKLFTCSNKAQFQDMMLQALKLNQNRLLQVLDTRGSYFSLYMADALRDFWMPESIQAKIKRNLQENQQRLTKQFYGKLLRSFPNQSGLIEKYQHPNYNYSLNKDIYTINGKTIIFKQINQSIYNIDYKGVDKLMVQITPHQYIDTDSHEAENWHTKHIYTGEDLAVFAKANFAEDHLYYQNGVFRLKYNEKLVQHYPPNVIHRYIANADRFPLSVQFLDLPTLYLVEEINSKNSIEDLERMTTLANLLNMFTKIQYLSKFEQICPRCTGSKKAVEMPTGYINILSQDNELFSESKLSYIANRIITECLSNNDKYTLMVVLSEQYSEAVKQQITKFQTTGINQFKNHTLEFLRDKIIQKAKSNQFTENVEEFMKKSILLELLFESNVEQTLQQFKDLGQEMLQRYMKIYHQYQRNLSLEALDPTGAQKLQTLFEKQPCYGLELIFGNQKEHLQQQYDQNEIQQICKIIQQQTSKTEKDNPSTKIKIKRNLL